MKVLVVGNYENDAQTSMQRFAALMVRGLTQAGHRVRTVRPRAVLGQLYPSERGFGKWLGYIDKLGVFPLSLRTALNWADVVHICDHANSLYTKYLQTFPHVVTCHDLLAVRSALGEIPQNRTSWTGRQFQRLILKGLAHAQHVVCVSEATRKDLLRIGLIPEHRVSRVYNSLSHPYSPMEQAKAISRIRGLGVDPSQSFILHVGGNQWYKNRLGVLRIFHVLMTLSGERKFKLVMVGKPWTAEMRGFVIAHRMTDVVLELTGATDEDLRALYSTAEMLLFPSLQEGFGWPIIEAQSCGCPVVTSNRPPMNEVGGDAAIYVDPENSELAAATVKRTLAKVLGARESSLRNAARFSESAMIGGYLSLYERVQREFVPSAQLIETIN
jgi:glycosyltransferase involved in cell wall biosynthesis